jgi:hypothetical protein
MNIDHVAADFGTFQKDYYIVEFGPRAGVLPLREGKIPADHPELWKGSSIRSH